MGVGRKNIFKARSNKKKKLNIKENKVNSPRLQYNYNPYKISQSVDRRNWQRGYWGRYHFFKKQIFFNKIIKSTIKSGHILKSYRLLTDLIRIVKKTYRISLYKFIDRLYNNLVPVVGYRSWHLGKIKYKVPYYNLNDIKHVKLSVKWFINSTRRNYKVKSKMRDRFIGEMLKIFNSNSESESLKKKREYYLEFFKNRSNIRFLRYFKVKKKSNK